MPKIDEATKLARLERIHLLLRRNGLGVTEAEIAEELQLERRTVNNYLRELEYRGRAYKDGLYWFPLVLKETRLRPFDLTPEEAVTLYLGARLLSKQQDKRNEPAETALLKLASVLKADAGVGDEIEQAARELAGRPVQGNYQSIYSQVVRGYIYRKKVELEYRPLGWSKPFSTLFSTYLLEPSPIGYTTYLIGHSSRPNAQRAYKLERIESARLTSEGYDLPPDFPGLDILRNAWSIVMGEETLRVLLRFSPRVRERVLETRWHPSQQTREEPDKSGFLLWEVQVADTLDLLPWIRSWGADVEVLEPEEMRRALERETQELVKLYQGMGTKKELFAHFREKDEGHKDPQHLWTHLTETSGIAGRFSGKIGLSKSGEILGLLHDLGKASEAYQKYLLSGEGIIDPDSDNYVDHVSLKGKIDHSTAGAQIIYRHLWDKGGEGRLAAQVLCLAIASHHSGLIDCLSPSGEDNFTRRMEKAEVDSHISESFSNLAENEKAIIEELFADDLLIKELVEKLKLVKEENESQETLMFKYGLLIRFLFSCLLDADRLNTADFEFPGNARLRSNNIYPSWDTLIERLNIKIDEYENKPNRNEVDEIRSQVSQSCLDFSARPKGIYQLTVPTGGGKTFASLRFALNHAAFHNKAEGKVDRIFYVIPYTSIIDQNAEEARQVFEDKDKNGIYLNKVVLEHHSNLTPDQETRRHNLLAENWDAPIIFTTQVQFLEALFGSGTRGARRMHQLANSIIIFDEIQTIPIRAVHMFNLALRFLVHSCGATVVLCTATQPLLDQVTPIQRALSIGPEQKIIPNEKELFQRLKRVEVLDCRKIGGWSDKEIADLALEELREKGSVLIVVNTKRSASSLYRAINEQGDVTPYHLSTNMCPAHRLEVLAKMKAELESKEPVICVSTQLVEAGVDIDFGVVIRYLAGMDSIAQAAGRCNRNGARQGFGNVWIVNPTEENLDKLKDIRIGREKAQTVLDDFSDNSAPFENDRIGLEAMKAYYQHYFYERQEEMCYKIGADSVAGRADDLFTLLSTNAGSMQERRRITDSDTVIPFRQSFQTAAKAFRVIDSLTQGVIVPHGKEGSDIIMELCAADDLEKQQALIRQAQRFSVNLFPYEFRKLADKNAVREVQKGAGIFYLDKQYYDEKLGWSDHPVNGTRS